MSNGWTFFFSESSVFFLHIHGKPCFTDIMDPCPTAQPVIDNCEKKCVNLKKLLDSCADRIESVKLKNPEATCELQFFDWKTCVDSCVCI